MLITAISLDACEFVLAAMLPPPALHSLIRSAPRRWTDKGHSVSSALHKWHVKLRAPPSSFVSSLIWVLWNSFIPIETHWFGICFEGVHAASLRFDFNWIQIVWLWSRLALWGNAPLSLLLLLHDHICRYHGNQCTQHIQSDHSKCLPRQYMTWETNHVCM